MDPIDFGVWTVMITSNTVSVLPVPLPPQDEDVFCNPIGYYVLSSGESSLVVILTK